MAWSAAVKAVLLAAGMSSRLRPLTDDRPKCLLTVAGQPILKRAVDALRGRRDFGIAAIADVVPQQCGGGLGPLAIT